MSIKYTKVYIRLFYILYNEKQNAFMVRHPKGADIPRKSSILVASLRKTWQ